jgi:hypothetical protein
VAAKALLAVGGVLVALGLAELALRAFKPQPVGISKTLRADLQLHEPQRRLVYRKPEFETVVEFNSLGLRDQEYPRIKPSHACRILVLGDSYTAALQVDASQIYTEVLEQSLNAAGGEPVFEVINAGVSGWGTADELRFLQLAGLSLDPDLVLLQFTIGNDVTDNAYDNRFFDVRDGHLVPRQPEGGRLLHSLEEFLGNRSHVVQLLRLRLRHALSSRASLWSRRSVEYHDTIRGRRDPREMEPDWEATFLYLREIRDLTRARGIGFSVFFVPFDAHVEGRKPNGPFPVEDYYPTEMLLRVGAREGIPMLDLTPVFRERSGGSMSAVRWAGDSHWRPEPHRWAAEALLDFLASAREPLSLDGRAAARCGTGVRFRGPFERAAGRSGVPMLDPADPDWRIP